MKKKEDPLSGFLDPADAIVACGTCGSQEGVPCKPTSRDVKPPKPRHVHIGRRIRRLLLTASLSYNDRTALEASVVKMLREHLS